MPDTRHQSVLDALKRGDVGEAESLCEVYLREGGGAEGLYLMGAIQSLKGDKKAAVRLIGRAAALLPDRADIAYNHGVVLRETGDVEKAIAAWGHAVARDPANRAAMGNLALALDQTGDGAGAVEMYGRILERWPEDRDALYNFGNLYQRAGDLDAAKPLYEKLAKVAPDFAPGWINHAMLLKRRRDWPGAEAAYRRAIAADPGSAGAHFNLGNLLLQEGRWREGFAEYEWRLRLANETIPRFPYPAWTGAERAGARVLLWGDQGYGDAIQFLRFVADVAARGHRAIVVTKTELKTLAATTPGVEAAFGPSDEIPEADVQIALASLPNQLGLDDPARFWTAPYLVPPAVSSPVSGAGLRVGLVWAGDPRHPNDAHRSARLEDLAALFDVPNISWHGFQLGAARAQLADSPWAARIADLSTSLVDFAASAAAMRDLDLIVTVDTSAAHLAGALGRPAYVMLPAFDCDWRWGSSGDKCAWYPTLKLFRQSAPNTWPEVARQVAAALTSRAK